MLEIESIAFRNFLSYGDYNNEVKLSNLGPCLIRGIISDSSDSAKSSNGAGKCLDGETLVLLSSGLRVPIKDLHAHIGSSVVSLDSNFKHTTGMISNWCSSGVKHCYKITTRSGRSIICTEDHKFLTFSGWNRLRDIGVGTPLAINRNLNISNDYRRFTIYEAELIGMMLGDGCFTSTPTICISDDEPNIRSRVEYLIKKINNGLELRVSKGIRKGKNYRIVINNAHGNKDGKRSRNPIAVFFDNLGLTGKTKENKFIPREFDHSSLEIIKHLIMGFWAADGTINIRKPTDRRRQRIDISCNNKSEHIITTIQHYLLRFDIRSRIRRRNALCSTSQKRFSTIVLEVEPNSYGQFLAIFGEYLEKLGCSCVHQASLTVEAIKTQLFASQNIDLIPHNIWETIHSEIVDSGTSWNAVAPNSIRLNKNNYILNKRSTSRKIVKAFANNLQSDYLTNIAESDVQWDSIVSIDDVGLRDTYDITISMCDDSEPNFSANDIITHNSTLINALLWCLFGKTMHSVNPGSKVLHEFSDGDCWAQIKFKNGNVLTRTYGRNGKSELIYEKAGYDIINTNLSTTGNEQKLLDFELELDWEVFCGSTFFTQYSTPWLEMGDQKRKKAIERVLHVDRFSVYADLSKNKKHDFELEHASIESRLEKAKAILQEQQTNLSYCREASVNFESSQRARIIEATNRANECAEKRKLHGGVINISVIKEKWELINQINQLIDGKRKQLESARNDISKLEREISINNATISVLTAKIKEWKEKSGKICTECEQSIPHTHTSDKIKPYVDQIDANNKSNDELRSKITALNNSITKFNQYISQSNDKLKSALPEYSVREAESHNKQLEQYDTDIRYYNDLIEKIKAEVDPNVGNMDAISAKIPITESNINKLTKELANVDVLIKHYSYINKLYSDRKKIKSNVIAEHIPYFNRRLTHYLESFNLDLKIQLNSSLGIDSNLWGYEFQSGGERRRTDVAFAMAMFDLHAEIYGKQSNIVVLDEVDGRLDQAGIDYLIDIINNDIATKADTVLIISHKNTINDVFPREITISRTNRQSRIHEVR